MALPEENDILFAHKALSIMAGLSDAAKRVAGAIIDHFNKRTGQCDPSIERLATLLGIDRATVIRATEKLHELGFIEKTSHGGKAHRAAYLPNWDMFRAIVEDWDARMKSGKASETSELRRDASKAAADVTACDAESRNVTRDSRDKQSGNVATLRRSRSQDCDVKGRSAATQTHLSNQSKEPVLPEQVETQGSKPAPRSADRSANRLLRGNKPQAQRSILLPITGGKSPDHAQAQRAAAERRWYAQLHQMGESSEASILDWLTAETSEAATAAEMRRRGAGIEFVLDAMMHQRSKQDVFAQ